jgi:hypothetical protein
MSEAYAGSRACIRDDIPGWTVIAACLSNKSSCVEGGDFTILLCEGIRGLVLGFLSPT